MLYCGLGVSLKQTALCVVDDDGRVVREAKLITDPEVIGRFLHQNELRCERLGVEAGGTSAWLCIELRRLGQRVVCIDAKHAAAALQAGFRNKKRPQRRTRHRGADAGERLPRGVDQVPGEPAPGMLLTPPFSPEPWGQRWLAAVEAFEA